MKIKNTLCASLAVLVMGAGVAQAMTPEKEAACKKDQAALLELQKHLNKVLLPTWKKAEHQLSLRRNPKNIGDLRVAKVDYNAALQNLNKRSQKFEATYRGSYVQSSACSNFVTRSYGSPHPSGGHIVGGQSHF